MSSGLYAAVCGEMAQERRIETVANNLANVNTTGFKGDISSFKALYPEIESGMLLTDPAAQRKLMLMQKMNMAYPAFATVTTDFSPGEIKNTGNPLDLTIKGKGFFVVNTPRGELYTRMGNFTLNEDNELVGLAGYRLQGEGGSIKFEGVKVAVGNKGAVEVYDTDDLEGVQVGTIRVIDFKDYSQLKKVGNNLFENTGGEENEKEAEKFEIDSHCLEQSNINIVKEMTQMINLLRICESYQKVIHAIDEMDAKATRDVAAVA